MNNKIKLFLKINLFLTLFFSLNLKAARSSSCPPYSTPPTKPVILHNSPASAPIERILLPINQRDIITPVAIEEELNYLLKIQYGDLRLSTSQRHAMIIKAKQESFTVWGLNKQKAISSLETQLQEMRSFFILSQVAKQSKQPSCWSTVCCCFRLCKKRKHD